MIISFYYCTAVCPFCILNFSDLLYILSMQFLFTRPDTFSLVSRLLTSSLFLILPHGRHPLFQLDLFHCHLDSKLSPSGNMPPSTQTKRPRPALVSKFPSISSVSPTPINRQDVPITGKLFRKMINIILKLQHMAGPSSYQQAEKRPASAGLKSVDTILFIALFPRFRILQHNKGHFCLPVRIQLQ